MLTCTLFVSNNFYQNSTCIVAGLYNYLISFVYFSEWEKHTLEREYNSRREWKLKKQIWHLDIASRSLLPVPKNKKPEKAFDSWFLRAMMRSIQFSHFSFLCKLVVLLYSAVIKIYPSWDTLPVKQLTRIFHAVSSLLIVSLSWAMVIWFSLTTYVILCYVSFSLGNLCSNVSS